MFSEITTLLSSTFGRLVNELHPISHARKGFGADHATQQTLWHEFAKGGWLEAGCEEFQKEYGSGTTLMGELTGRALLTLPYADSVFLAATLCERFPAVREQNVVLDLTDYPASMRCDDDKSTERWFDVYGARTQHLHLTCKENNWYLRRYTAQDIERVEGLDPCVQLGRLKANAEIQAQATLPADSVLPALQQYLIFLLADSLGAASASLDESIAYAKERRQFGKPIGQFQAIKHPLVNAWMALDNGRYALAGLLDSGEQIDAALSATANRLIVEAAKQTCKLAVQVHGGIGFSWEHNAQLYLKRVYRTSIETSRIAHLLQSTA